MSSRKERNETRPTPPAPQGLPRTAPGVRQPPHAAGEPAGLAPLFTLDELGTWAARILSVFTIPRVLLVSALLLAVLAPLAVHNRRGDVRLLQAGDLFDHQKWSEAAAIYGSLGAPLLDRPDVSLDYARCLLELGDGAAAQACVDRAKAHLAQASPRILPALQENLPVLSAWAQIANGDAEQGVAALEPMASEANALTKRLNKENVRELANLALGRYYLRSKKMAEAAECYRYLAHREKTAYALAEFREALQAVEAQIPAELLEKVPEQVVRQPDPTPQPTAASAAESTTQSRPAARPAPAARIVRTPVGRPSAPPPAARPVAPTGAAGTPASPTAQ